MTFVSGHKNLRTFLLGLVIFTAQIEIFPASYTSIDSVYKVSQRHFAKKDFTSAHEVLGRVVGEPDSFENILSETNRPKILPILNDYAFYLYKDFESQSKMWCAEPDETTARDFMAFRSRTLEKSKAALEFVLSQDSTREVALLNLADVYLNLDEPEKAGEYYSKYIAQMTSKRKASKIVPRARQPSLRRRAFDCD